MGQYDAQIWSDLHAGGLNDVAAAGVMGNMSQESSMNPSTPGGGLMQWIGSRWTALVNYARSQGLDPNSEKAQVGYFFQELNAGNEGITKSGLNGQPSAAAAADYVSTQYERPAKWAANNPHRESEANRFYQQYAGTSPIQGTGGIGGDTLPGLTQTSASGPTSQPANAFPKGTDIIDEIDKSLQIQSFDIKNPIGSITQDMGAISLRMVLVLVGLILLIFGLLAVVEKAGVNVVA